MHLTVHRRGMQKCRFSQSSTSFHISCSTGIYAMYITCADDEFKNVYHTHASYMYLHCIPTHEIRVNGVITAIIIPFDPY